MAAGSYLSDQTRIGGSLGFSHKASKRLTWNLKYSVWQNDYQNYANTRSHSATVGFSGVLTPSVTLDLDAGPAYTEKSDVAGYVVNLSLAKQMRTNRFSAGYSRLTGDTTGLGGTSDSHQGRLSFSQSLGRKISINFDAVGFKQSLPYDYWGGQGSAAFSWQLARHWVATMGGSYMQYDTYNSKRVLHVFRL